MSTVHTFYLVSLFVAAVAALISGLALRASLREREASFAWAYAVVFLVSSLLTALYFWRLL